MLKERFLHRVLNGFDIDNALVARADFFFHTVYHALHRAIVFPCGSGGERYRANDEFAVVVHDVAISLSDLHGLLPRFSCYAKIARAKAQHLV